MQSQIMPTKSLFPLQKPLFLCIQTSHAVDNQDGQNAIVNYNITS